MIALICLSISFASADEVLIRIEKIHGNQMYLTGKGLTAGQHYLVFGTRAQEELKGEVKVLKREKTGYWLAKQVEIAIAGFASPRFRRDDHLVKFNNYSILEVGRIPIFYAGEYFRLSGILDNIRCFGENLLYLKFRSKSHPHYIKEEKVMPFGNYYAEKPPELTRYFVMVFTNDQLDRIPEVGKEYLVYGRFVDAKPYLTFDGLKLIAY